MIKKLSTVAMAGALTFGAITPAFAHEVKSGDTMYEIAMSYNMSVEELASLNPQIKNLDLIYVGETVNTNKNDRQTPLNVTHSPSKAIQNNSSMSDSQIDLFARLVSAEAESEPYIGKVAVAEVVLNRINSSEFPNTLEGVIYQKNQFSPVTNGAIYKMADADSIKAVHEALTGNTNYSNGALFFYDPANASSRWLDSLRTVAVIGGHTFKNK